MATSPTENSRGKIGVPDGGFSPRSRNVGFCKLQSIRFGQHQLKETANPKVNHRQRENTRGECPLNRLFQEGGKMGGKSSRIFRKSLPFSPPTKCTAQEAIDLWSHTFRLTSVWRGTTSENGRPQKQLPLRNLFPVRSSIQQARPLSLRMLQQKKHLSLEGGQKLLSIPEGVLLDIFVGVVDSGARKLGSFHSCALFHCGCCAGRWIYGKLS